MNNLHEPVISNCFNFYLELYSMYSAQSEDFIEVLAAWAKVIGVNLKR